MKTKPVFLLRLTVVLCIISLIWLGYNTYMYLDFPKFIMRDDTLMWIAIYGLILFFFSHLVIIFSAVNSFRNSKSLTSAEIILIVFGILSFVVLMAGFILMNEIEDDITNGYPYMGLIRIVWISHFINVSFFLYALFYFIRLLRLGQEYSAPKSVSREQLFVALNMIGIVCSLWCMLIVFVQFSQFRHMQLELHFNNHLRPAGLLPYLFVLLPYISVLLLWLVRYIHDKRAGWFDEKQKRDIYASGMSALLVGLPIIVVPVIYCYFHFGKVFFQLNFAGTISVLWMMFYLFMILLSFSCFSIYNFRRN
ncbi:MAG TPA: hypothetical protein VK179_20245 [Bacteroidales bacterium]|nr:hypothetical protein [Bacteroidales bacterium]